MRILSSPGKSEIDDRTLKLIVGVIAISLATVTSLFAEGLVEDRITSISASYHAGGWARDYFVGSLFAIFAFLLGYNGFDRREMLLSKTAAIAALGVAFVPCTCPELPSQGRDVHPIAALFPFLHAAAALAMFLILAVFCYLFRCRALAKGHVEAMRRTRIYAVCGVVILTAIAVIVIDGLTSRAISAAIERLTYYGEMAGLVAFGIAWLTASRILPVLSSPEERLRPFA